MSIIRINKTKNYTVMSNYHLRDNNLSLKAKGLLSQMFSLPENWDYTVDGLAHINKESRSAIESALKELKVYGYLVVTKKLPNETESGRIEYVYDIYETPNGEWQGIYTMDILPEVEEQETEKQATEKQGVENQWVENLGVNKIKNNKIKNINIKNNNKFIRPTLDEVKEYCNERKNGVDAQRFVDYYTSNGWKVGKNKMQDWKAAVRTWERSTQKQTEKDTSLSDIFK